MRRMRVSPGVLAVAQLRPLDLATHKVADPWLRNPHQFRRSSLRKLSSLDRVAADLVRQSS